MSSTEMPKTTDPVNDAYDAGYERGLCAAQQRQANADPIQNALNLMEEAVRELQRLGADADCFTMACIANDARNRILSLSARMKSRK